MDPLGLLLGERTGPDLKALGVHGVGQHGHGDRVAHRPEAADGVAEVARGLAQVVRLGVGLAGQDL